MSFFPENHKMSFKQNQMISQVNLIEVLKRFLSIQQEVFSLI